MSVKLTLHCKCCFAISCLVLTPCFIKTRYIKEQCCTNQCLAERVLNLPFRIFKLAVADGLNAIKKTLEEHNKDNDVICPVRLWVKAEWLPMNGSG